MEKYFSPWFYWNDRNQYCGIKFPGVYVVAESKDDISETEFSFREEIIYVGMSNAVKGLEGRLKSFDNTIQFLDKPPQHGGADRVRYKHQCYKNLVKNLYVSLRHFRCFPANETAKDLRTMGKVVNAEYQCMAQCVEELGALPEFNRKKESAKYSRSYKQG
ncbi:hypothetical protein [Crenothrix sp.]|uniref:hypothetical protein n=1 Tax=Crenothrix sp. TaxID=3100433 RepID=UPI00374DE498